MSFLFFLVDFLYPAAEKVGVTHCVITIRYQLNILNHILCTIVSNWLLLKDKEIKVYVLNSKLRDYIVNLRLYCYDWYADLGDKQSNDIKIE